LKSNDIKIQLDESENDEDESLAMVAKRLKKMFRKHPEFKGIWRKLS